MSKKPKPKPATRVRRTEAECFTDEHGNIDRSSDICKMLFVIDPRGFGEKIVILDAAEEKSLRRRVRELERIHANVKPTKKGRRR